MTGRDSSDPADLAELDADLLARWRVAFTSPRAPDRGRADAPPAEQIWRAVHGELAPAETAALAAKMAADPALAEEWQLAVKARDALTAELEQPVRDVSQARRPGRSRLAAGLVSVLAVAAAITLWLRPAPPDEQVYRDAAGEELWGHRSSQVTELREPTLRWSEIAGARRYRVRLMTAALEVIAERETEAPELALDERLAPVFAWQVEALAADGALIARSPTFRAQWRR